MVLCRFVLANVNGRTGMGSAVAAVWRDKPGGRMPALHGRRDARRYGLRRGTGKSREPADWKVCLTLGSQVSSSASFGGYLRLIALNLEIFFLK